MFKLVVAAWVAADQCDEQIMTKVCPVRVYEMLAYQ